MFLYVVRHGIAIDREDPNCPPDPERSLTSEGIRKTKAVSRGLRKLRLKPDAILSSPYVRAIQTAGIVAKSLKYPIDKIRRTQALVPDSPPAALFRSLARLDAETVICCGHAPNVDEIIAHVLKTDSDIWNLKKAGVACLGIDSFSPVHGELLWLATPKMLAMLK